MNFYYCLEPYFAILNSTSSSIFSCTKYNDDNQGFEITTVPAILSDKLQIFEHRQNKTAIEIIIDSIGFIGEFKLICSSINNQSFGIQADVYIGRKLILKISIEFYKYFQAHLVNLNMLNLVLSMMINILIVLFVCQI